jgi:acyl-CoA synthetase (NDP forming)/GNAT superfamily N-acetyltransferase
MNTLTTPEPATHRWIPFGVFPADVLLADGTIAVIRPVVAGDAEELGRLCAEADDESMRFRFFSLSRQAAGRYLDHVLGSPEVPALVAVHDGRLIAMATAEPLDDRAAEIAFLVADGWHGLGVGSLLLEHLAAVARDQGVERFVAEVLADNHRMLDVLVHAGFTFAEHADSGTVHVEMDTAASPRMLEAADDREFASEARSLRPLLFPTSVAVYGVKRDGTGVGAAVLRSIVAGRFAGSVRVVHPTAHHVDGVPAVPTLARAGSTDLAVVAVPADQVLAALRDAADAGVHAAVVISSGFGELGKAGADLQRQVLSFARSHDLRIVGPNCLGLTVNDPDIRLNATFGPAAPPAGGLAVASQSGGVGIVLADLARELDLGVRTFVSLGNKCDVSSNDLLAAWANDPDVTAAALYLESFGNAPKFARFARRFAERKPLLAVVGGRSASGQRAGASHTAAAATPSIGIDALFAQAGVIGCSDAEDLAETALLLTEQPLPAGPRVGVLSNAGGMGVLAADAADRAGLVVPELSAALRARIADHVHDTTGTGNPVDAGAAASPARMAALAGDLLASDEVDAVLVVLVATGVTDAAATARAVGATRRTRPGKPMLVVPMGGLTVASHDLPGTTIFRSVGTALSALSRAATYSAWRAEQRDDCAPVDVVRAADARRLATTLLDGALPTGGWLDSTATAGLLGPYGLAPSGRTVVGGDAAATVAAELGYPVAVKVATGSVVHKTERGLVRTGIADEAQLRDTLGAFAAELGRDDTAVLVQPMATGVEMALGVVRDPAFGPLVMVGAGGVVTELWDDRVFLVPPLTRRDVARALRSLRTWPLLAGYRGTAPADVEALEEVTARLGRLVEEVPEVAELDLNPVVVTRAGAVLVDVKVRLDASGSPDAGVPRRLRRPGPVSTPA